MQFYDFYGINSWFKDAANSGYDVESWGMFGSKSAHDVNGKIKGEWIAPGDTSDGRAAGWLDTVQD